LHARQTIEADVPIECAVEREGTPPGGMGVDLRGKLFNEPEQARGWFTL
ncbi:MAG: hypothetical protein H0T87_10155, partial [Gammaproteobacteria bacterium]|nr:hypothetical protein [Gammaproteobacteria bacterium]